MRSQPEATAAPSPCTRAVAARVAAAGRGTYQVFAEVDDHLRAARVSGPRAIRLLRIVVANDPGQLPAACIQFHLDNVARFRPALKELNHVRQESKAGRRNTRARARSSRAKRWPPSRPCLHESEKNESALGLPWLLGALRAEDVRRMDSWTLQASKVVI